MQGGHFTAAPNLLLYICTFFRYAQEFGVKVALHIEPYPDLNATNFRANLEYIRGKYSSHPAYYKRNSGRRRLPVFYVYDSYRLKAEEWRRLFSRKGDLTVRDTDLDAVFLGLLVEFRHRAEIKRAKFDGFYTYFAANGFSHGSSWKSWRDLADFARRNSLIFVPSVGPGYVDTRIRPWNAASTRQRQKGTYYGKQLLFIFMHSVRRLIRTTSGQPLLVLQ